ncbi:MAG TPA: sugar ABC transporter permease [Stellaceae bacterium]|nr:sugar ABC transporter permease [Stellaceae bacterium]
MTGVRDIAAVGPFARDRRTGRRVGAPYASELVWAVAFILPYAAVFAGFGLYPIAYGLWIGKDPALYAELFANAHFFEVALNTAIFAGFGANAMMVLALLLSGFFMQRRRWIKALLVLCLLPWALPAIPAYVSFHWMLLGEYGLLNSLARELFGLQWPVWFNERWTALAADIVAYMWKWLPFWILIFLAGRMAIPPDLYEAADIDGADGPRRFFHVTLPLLANLYLICTALCAIWIVGDFSAAKLVSVGSPGMSSEVLASLSVRYAFVSSRPGLGVAAALSTLLVLVPLVVLLMRRIEARRLQL